ncbi:Uncharacterised protein [Mycoplasmopsis californica]|uniref:Uncharacterized protein n=1 Tax=Mycoplasmopsis equigenitalium TaxID=114883 RepID=A0ABY5J6G1_9BACT|nr:hypothetical protein [Mycoplasmopsis equigenitalium]UUD37268.1 hypothetical protein NPA09_01710 [Mycoplasmopsis equigenitalium]VEU69423.1 Uncharacterised protein [Mycoplasmopsis californica]
MINTKPFTSRFDVFYRFCLVMFYLSFVLIIPIIIYVFKKKQIYYEVNLIKTSLEKISNLMLQISPELNIYNSHEFFDNYKLRDNVQTYIDELNVLIDIYNLHIKLLRKEFLFFISKLIILKLRITDYDLLETISIKKQPQ